MIFLILLLMSSFFICGLYHISKHHVVIMPDGKRKTQGEIFKWFSEFIEQYNGYISYQYKEDQLEEKYRVLIAADRKMKDKLIVGPEKMSLIVGHALTKEERQFIDDILQVKTRLNANVLFLFLDIPKYTFPEWIRKPVISCPTCMASVWGSIIWWVFVYLQQSAFAWSTHPDTAPLFMWPFFCISLSFMNYLWSKKAEF